LDTNTPSGSWLTNSVSKWTGKLRSACKSFHGLLSGAQRCDLCLKPLDVFDLRLELSYLALQGLRW